MWSVHGEKDGKWFELKIEFKTRVESLIEELSNDGYGRISVEEK